MSPAIAYANGTWVAIGCSGCLLNSKDGVAWTNSDFQSRVGNIGMTDVTQCSGTWTSVGFRGTLFTSTDASHWSKQESGTAKNLWRVAGASNGWVAVGANFEGASGIIAISEDGRNWTEITNPATSILRAIGFGDGRWIAVGNAGNILTSLDLKDWKLQCLDPQLSFEDVLYERGRCRGHS